MSAPTATPTREAAVRQVLGAGADLRDAQQDALDGLERQDTLLVARSGAGKTAVYAIATLVTGRLTVVLSPLVALQRDQVDGLTDAGLHAASLNSLLGVKAQREVLDRAVAGELDVVLLAPEQIVREAVLDRLRGADVGLVVVDEAHCVSEWGHDFRPDYLHVGAAVERLGRPRVLALTATASPAVRAEVVDGLGLQDPRVLVHDADRPNIWLGAHVHADDATRDRAVVEAVLATQGAAIVYARTHRHVEELTAAVTEAGRPALAYHAGLRTSARLRAQDDFLAGRADLVIATSAFGMGVDRADVRLVVHAGAPSSLDAYYQEVGRAGRDGEPAVGILHVTGQDWPLNRYLGTGGGSRPATLRAVLRALDEGPADRTTLAERSGRTVRTVSRALAALERVGAVATDDGGWRRAELSDRVALARVAERRDRRRALEESRVDMVRTYAETSDCRRRLLLELLGEHHPERCEQCDTCDAGSSVDADTDGPRPGTRVRHRTWGPGTVQSVEQGRLTVLFPERGYVTLEPDLSLDTGVLVTEPAEPAGPAGPDSTLSDTDTRVRSDTAVDDRC